MKTQEEMNILVPQKLQQVEQKYQVKVLWAVESGSRAWGFASPDSDFDVRFIYKRPMERYLELEKSRDVIELPIDDTWDVSGWDLDKALKLLYRSNPSLYEWLASPICYWRTDFADRIHPFMREYFSVERMLYHYRNTAVRHMRDYLSGEMIQPKKYFYALRPILACDWIMDSGNIPPVLFAELVDAELPEKLRGTLDYLLELKMNGPEKMTIAPIPEIGTFLRERIQKIDKYIEQCPKQPKKNIEPLDQFFLKELRTMD